MIDGSAATQAKQLLFRCVPFAVIAPGAEEPVTHVVLSERRRYGACTFSGSDVQRMVRVESDRVRLRRGGPSTSKSSHPVPGSFVSNDRDLFPEELG
jgi:hypothetical protein